MIEVTMVMVLLSLPLSPAPIIIGLITFAVYANDRIVDADADAVSKPEQVEFVLQYRDELYVSAAGAYGISVAMSILGGPVAFFLALLPGIFWVVYATDWIPEIGIHVKRLKEVLIVNSALVALAWAVSLTFIPLAFADRAVTPAVGIVFLYFFLRSFIDTEIPNIRDVRSDRVAGVKTMPVVFGIDRTRIALLGIDVLTLLMIGLAVVFGYLSRVLAFALGVGLLYSLGVTSLLGSDSERDWITIAPEFEYVVVGISLLPIVLGV